MKKIMFNDKHGLTEAVLSGRKTVTRRVMTKQPAPDDIAYMELKDYPCQPPYQVGEIVAVAQSYKDLGYSETALDRDPNDVTNVRGTLKQSGGWNNKMFVRAEACKRQIRITSVGPERLQDITNEDCLREGICIDSLQLEWKYFVRGIERLFKTPRAAYASLIDKIIRRGTWNKNPFVWRIEFELVK